MRYISGGLPSPGWITVATHDKFDCCEVRFLRLFDIIPENTVLEDRGFKKCAADANEETCAEFHPVPGWAALYAALLTYPCRYNIPCGLTAQNVLIIDLCSMLHMGTAPYLTSFWSFSASWNQWSRRLRKVRRMILRSGWRRPMFILMTLKRQENARFVSCG